MSTSFSHLQLRTLGEALATAHGEPLRWPARSAEELLWYLHAQDRGAYRARILSELWGLEEDAAAGNRFRVALHRLRAALGSSEAVCELRGVYSLHPALRARSDTETLRQMAAQPQSGVAPPAGVYLPQVRAEWAEAPRRAYAALLTEVELACAAQCCQQRNCALALQTLQRTLQTDPLISEEQHQRLMVCLATVQGPAAAIEHYRRYRKFLRDEVGDTPMPETETLAEQIKVGGARCTR